MRERRWAWPAAEDERTVNPYVAGSGFDRRFRVSPEFPRAGIAPNGPGHRLCAEKGASGNVSKQDSTYLIESLVDCHGTPCFLASNYNTSPCGGETF